MNEKHKKKTVKEIIVKSGLEKMEKKLKNTRVA